VTATARAGSIRGRRSKATGIRSRAPKQWPDALGRPARSAFLADALGADMLRIFLAIKRQESARFAALVSNRDYEWYLDSV
jgi:glutamine synthetase